MTNSTSVKATNPTKTSRLEKTDKKLMKPFYSLLSIAIGFAIAFIIIIIIGSNPLLFISNIFKGNFYSWSAFGNFLATFSWMILVGLSVAIAFRTGLFNIGVAGQMMAGGMTGFLFAYYVDIPSRAAVIFSILIPVLAGMLVAWFIGLLKVRFRINEAVSSIMINWVIFYFYKLLTNASYWNGMVDSNSGGTVLINSNYSLSAPWLNDIFGPNSYINIGIFIAIAVFVVIAIMYKFTLWGRKQDLLGSNQSAARYIGMNHNREIYKKMMLSGALAGLAGSIYYLGIKESLPAIGLDIPGEGFNGITISLLAFNNPIGVLFSSIFISMLINANLLVSSALDPEMSDLIIGIIILTISLSQFLMIYQPISKLFKKFKKQNQQKPQPALAGDGTSESSSNQIIKEKQSLNLESNNDSINNDIDNLNNNSNNATNDSLLEFEGINSEPDTDEFTTRDINELKNDIDRLHSESLDEDIRVRLMNNIENEDADISLDIFSEEGEK